MVLKSGGEVRAASLCVGASDRLAQHELQRCLQAFPLDVAGWQLCEVLHHSENAVIFLARAGNGSLAAIKRFKFDVGAVNATRVRRFLREFRALRLPGVVHLLDVGLSHQAIYLVMEYVQGDTLRNHLLFTPAPALTCRLDWFEELAAILGGVHSAGFLHRDLKTSNILVRENGSLVLLDFGVESRLLVEAGFIRSDEIYCTPYYVSPERLLGETADERADLYALGVILFELLMGKKPFEGEGLADILKQHILASIPRLPPALVLYQPLLDALLAKFPEDRLPLASDVLKTLHEIRRGAHSNPVAVNGE